MMSTIEVILIGYYILHLTMLKCSSQLNHMIKCVINTTMVLQPSGDIVIWVVGCTELPIGKSQDTL